jgi:hypothetical protein
MCWRLKAREKGVRSVMARFHILFAGIPRPEDSNVFFFQLFDECFYEVLAVLIDALSPHIEASCWLIDQATSGKTQDPIRCFKSKQPKYRVYYRMGEEKANMMGRVSIP